MVENVEEGVVVNSNVAIAVEDELITMKEYAEEVGRSVSTISERFKKFGLKPVIEAKHTNEKMIPARYSRQQIVAFQAQQQQQEAQKIEEKAIALANDKEEIVIATAFKEQQYGKFENVEKEFKDMVFNGITSLLQVLEEKNKQGDKVKELENQLEQALIEKEELEKKQEECEIVFGKRISKKELQARIHRNVDELTCDYNLEREDVYNFLYEKFSLQHPFVNFKEQKEKTKLEYLMQNNYGRELLEILLQKDFIPSEFKKVK